MFKRKQTRAIQKFIYSIFKQFWQLTRTASRKLSRWLIRNLLHKGYGRRHQATAKAGFVLPTITLLLLVVALVIGAILLRTGSRTSQVIGAREEQVIYNAATPAIERAKAKLEYLFQQDTRRPTGAASDQLLTALLVNNDINTYPSDYQGLTTVLSPDPYTLPDETQYGRLDINNDGRKDPAWAYRTDVDNDGTPETVVYGIFVRSRSDDRNITINGLLGKDANGNPIVDANSRPDTDVEKAAALVTRNGPINTANLNDRICASITQTTTPPPATPLLPVDESVWFPVGSGVLRKTFQIDAIVISNKAGTSRTVATLEFQQDRQLDRANRWGAWFRYDMEIYPGAGFNWNGAMYTAGSLFIGSQNQFRAYLISARQSCFYGKDSSEITVLEEPIQKGFQGQIVAKQVRNEQAGSALFDLQEQGANDSPPDTNTSRTTLDGNTDSVGGENAKDLALDPVLLFTQDKSSSINIGPDIPNETFSPARKSNRNARNSSWDSTYFKTRGRIRNNQQNPPYVDDTYRADNRYGPKPKYDQVDPQYALDSSSKKNGQPIPSSVTKLVSNTSNAISDPEFRALGLDGYWERRAWANGLRIIVSPRLELGNAYGWVNSSLNSDTDRDDPGEIDPLYPVNPDSQTSSPISHEQQQRRTLRDNLAAVQATVVYHQDSNLGNPAGNVPIACLATTVHPGTQQTDLDSRNFQLAGQRYWYPNQSQALVSDFFYGIGTNGWEYTVPSQNEFNSGSLRNALDNLAKFAGDYTDANQSGAFPPTQRGDRVYPSPYLTMWGNFSNLKRALTLPTNNSIADDSYIHTAGCVVGMLANNINYFIQAPNYDNSWWNNGTASFTSLSTALKTAVGTTTSPWPSGYKPTPDDYIAKLTAGSNDEKLARFVHVREQINRDRKYGFADSPNTGGFQYTVKYLGASTGTTPPTNERTLSYAGVTYSSVAGAGVTDKINLGCDLTANNYFGLGDPNNWSTTDRLDKEERLIILATSLCSTKPKFPSLYYIFPTTNHDRTSAPSGATLPTGEPYLSPPSPNNNSYSNEQFTSVDPTTITMVRPKGENWSGGNNSANGNWYLPTDGSANPSGETDFQIKTPSGGNRYVSLIDSAFFDSREKMTVRALNIDINLLRRNTIGNNNTWLPRSGIVYAFREDAVREDAIARPANGTNPNNNTNPGSPTDPQSASNGISPKPVDFYPDPDRRPYGFRLRNGQDLRRTPNGSVDNNNPRGLTFVSDNPVYIQGNFNFHSTDGNSNNLEEFRTALDSTWGNFYSRGSSGLEDRFARIGDGKDTWRPAEILSDAINILSNNFTEGYLDLGITDNTSVISGGRYSFRAMNGPSTRNPSNGWVLENGTVRATSSTLPIKISRNGNPIYCNTTPTNGYCPSANLAEWRQSDGYTAFSADYRSNINQASETRVNAIIVSGIVPTREGQQNGGFHNFPRYIENWSNTNSFISGSFVQLNFSTYATAPYNQVAWEPGSSPSGNNIQYYQPPNRSWGYDVGLQYAPAGPLSQRFVTSGIPRSEFYRDLKVDDPYICRLRRALNAQNSNIDPASVTECPN
uniref:Uncharacterized protein n=1 Tax=Phormidium sp. KS TaxID=654446 RepID=A0A3G9CLD2_9CYAN|nr:hypothetical protein [Phormidium sp. KS]